ncbi:MAG: hypothetical protein NTU80_05320 [Verrucomicrobia bacterium]|nr:hypothetical protein [Verrucomicrobiota bacterium]
MQADANQPTPRFASQLGYHGWLNDIAASSGAKLVAYQNLDDFWLATGETSFGLSLNWVRNNMISKPDDRFGLGQYDFDLVNGVRRPSFTSGLTITRWVSDPHEAMAYVSRSRTRALGAEPATGKPTPPGFTSINLQSYGFARPRYDHSGQFQRNIQLMYGNENGVQWSEAFYHRLMRDLSVD